MVVTQAINNLSHNQTDQPSRLFAGIANSPCEIPLMLERLCRYFTRLIPDTTNRKTSFLKEAEPGYSAHTVNQFP
ncbi:MAG: hypothetical protein KAK04_00905, partial [Cyclobacteriaceae bacterium]|nr:hypothetical protein [Cyclobacteriaceae bacterium]